MSKEWAQAESREISRISETRSSPSPSLLVLNPTSEATYSLAQESLASLTISVPHAPGLTVQLNVFIFKNCYVDGK